MPPARPATSDLPATLLVTGWQAPQQTLIRAIREAVFIEEQGIPRELEWDDRDASCTHLLAMTDAGEAVATARLTADGRIGRMAVLPAWRGRGIGSAMLARLVRLAAQRGLPRVRLHAQLESAAFYQRAGFRQYGDVFLAAGIPHVGMEADTG